MNNSQNDGGALDSLNITTLNQLGEILLRRMDSLTESVNQRIDNMESKILQQNMTSIQIQNDVQTVKSEIADHKKDVEKKMNEKDDRNWRLNNIVIMGAPETAEGNALTQKLLEIILPHKSIHLSDTRIGAPKNSQTGPRPLRIFLDNGNDKRTALNNSKLLKDMKKFDGIYVKRDLTKEQQLKAKEARESQTSRTPVRTRSVTKRKSTSGDESENPISKHGRLNETMDSA